MRALHRMPRAGKQEVQERAASRASRYREEPVDPPQERQDEEYGDQDGLEVAMGADVGRRLRAGLYSPRVAAMMARVPSRNPSSNWFCLKRGLITLSMILPAIRSVSTPCSPRPTSMRILRSAFDTMKMTPLSLPCCPIFQRRRP